MNGQEKTRVSIGMPVYNGENFITEAIDSILAQTFSDFELIISDNASTDKTEELCRMYAERDQRIRYYRNDQNIGAAANINRLVELARGEYFCWVHHDDGCLPEYLERCVAVLDKEAAVVLCYARTYIIDQHSHIIDHYNDNLLLHSPRSHQRFRTFLERPGLSTAAYGLIRLDILRQTGLIGDFAYSDRNFLGELALWGEFREVPEYLFLKREHPQISNKLYKDDYQLTVFLDPKKRGKLLFPKWRRLIEYFQAMERVHLSWYERTWCALYLAQYLLVPKRVIGMLKEPFAAARIALYRMVRPAASK